MCGIAFDGRFGLQSAAIAQSVERIHGKDEVTSSNLVRGSIFCVVNMGIY